MKKLVLIFVVIVGVVTVFTSCTKTKDNVLRVYSPHKEILINLVVDMYQKDTGKKVEVITAGTGELIARAKVEKDNTNADVFWGGSMNTLLPESELFAEYRSPNEKNVEDAFKNVDGKVTRFSAIPSTIIINKKTLQKICGNNAEIIGYQSIIDLEKKCPSLKGMISNANPGKSSSSYEQLINQLWAYAYIVAKEDLEREATVDDITKKYIDKAWERVAKLIAVYDSKHATGSGAVITDVIQGETAVGLSYEMASAEAADNSDDIDLIYPVEGSVVKADGVAILKGAKNMEGAKEFVDYLLSEKIQNAIKTVYRRAVIKNADFTNSPLAPLNTFKVIKDNSLLNNKEENLKKYDELFNQ